MNNHDDFRSALYSYLQAHQDSILSENGDWIVKGFIDIRKRIYSISLDTKVLSKILELLLLPLIRDFATQNGFIVQLAEVQNQYPDVTLVSSQEPTICYALDIKTTYLTGVDKSGQWRVNGMTLGTFGGYFRNRSVKAGALLPYNSYLRHYVLGAVYQRVIAPDELRVYHLEELPNIPSVARDFQFFLHEKYRIASDIPGSGNTKNIGSTRFLNRLLDGTGVFSSLGIEVFDDYWMHYQTQDMARKSGATIPSYSNLRSYQQYKQAGSAILNIPTDNIPTESDVENLSSMDANEQ